MKLKLNDIFKICIGEDIELSKEYEYYVCIGEKDQYYILHEFHKYCELNSMDSDTIDDIDEYFKDVVELSDNHFKKVNDLEAAYYKTKQVEAKPKKPGRKFVKV